MQTSVYLAKLIGPILLVAGLALVANAGSFRKMAQDIVRIPIFLFLFGLLDLTAGLAIVLAHNVWVADWPLIITLLGWLGIVRGVIRILLPNQLIALASRMVERTTVFYVGGGATLVLGAVLCFFGYID